MKDPDPEGSGQGDERFQKMDEYPIASSIIHFTSSLLHF
jgi:hypothetical protein